MSEKAVEKIISILIENEENRAAFSKDPQAFLDANGIALNELDLESLLSLEETDFKNILGDIDVTKEKIQVLGMSGCGGIIEKMCSCGHGYYAQ